MSGGQGHGAFGPDRQGPLAVTDAVAVEGQVNDELARGGPPERAGGPVERDRPEDRDLDGVAAHAENGPGQMVAEWGQAQFVGAEGFEPSLGTV